ncbi:hypothetical protein CEXT_291301 [Caerostris extrusa]|uniref:Uncharacterized protein n=1 Tax=Caerostris extrusa TaxID=172846 RepID=A0AAV4W5T6_CAEEX|nr:hypothetical protein CEXT_291301 [Caerostris extrusa]
MTNRGCGDSSITVCCCASTGKVLLRALRKYLYPRFLFPVDNPSSDLDYDPDDGPTITKEALHCQKLLEAEKDLAHAKVKYDAALGFINWQTSSAIMNLDKMSTSKMTMEAFHLGRGSIQEDA